MRYYIDTEFNGSGGQLLSIALVREDGAQFHEALHPHELIVPWVREHVMPQMDREPVDRATMVRKLQKFLRKDGGPFLFVADWPEDLAHFCALLIRDHGKRNDPMSLSCLLVHLPGFDTAAHSARPHNALADAIALKERVEANLRGAHAELSEHDLARLRVG
ncbi:3'-5' exoribonuclease [Sphingomonas sp.]|uniref:3'-5' exoribonuclease n=1 Tax=Sphingomonas sp. TaxID=28214 RepID=UPI001EC1390E|nr:3'-5' exoribonuclease [Sphingomonas sp.]MBX3594836.1 3'-5' exoribonuclease [Sphingomonas sp.]